MYRKYLLAAARRNWFDIPLMKVRVVRDYVVEAYKKDVGERCDVLGLDKLQTALQTILLAEESIGLRGSIFVATLLRAIQSDTIKSPSVIQALGSDVEDALISFQRVDNLLSTQTEAMESDDFRNLFVSQCGDMRVVLLLIADCVVRMRLVRDTEHLVARQFLSVKAARLFAPLAHKLGLYALKSELEDLSLKYLEHDAYYHIKDKLSATKRSRDAYIERFIAPLCEKLDAEGLRYHIKGRTKSIHSIWQKMKKQRCDFEGVYDLFAIRIIIDAPLSQEKALCWKAFSIVTYEYESNLRRLRDWLTVPKSNGYESLHITVLGPEEKWVEVQIRTERMDEIAEHGLAAHWRYKGVKSAGGGVDDWLTDIRAALEQGNENALAKSLGTGFKENSVYVFSPKGDLYKLPLGATVLDFAYLIHTGVGNRCVGGRVEGRNVPIRYKLESGQRVEIITSHSQSPKMEWLNIVVSPRAKAKIRAAINDLRTTEAVIVRETLERKLKNRKLEWDESVWNQLVKRVGYKETSDFYKAIASERLEVNTVIEQYAEALLRENRPVEHLPQRSAEEFSLEHNASHQDYESNDVLVIGQDIKGIDFQMARCCSPVYGDDVFGFVTAQNGIKVHRVNCPNALALRTRFPYRVVRARWAGKGSSKYGITLRVVGNDDLGIVNNVTSIISKEERIMLRNISIDSHDGLFSGILTVMVDDTQVLNALIKKLRTVKGVKAVSRT